MTQQASDHRNQASGQSQAQAMPAFKPVALPALAAAVQAAKARQDRPQNRVLPAILRKEAALG